VGGREACIIIKSHNGARRLNQVRARLRAHGVPGISSIAKLTKWGAGHGPKAQSFFVAQLTSHETQPSGVAGRLESSSERAKEKPPLGHERGSWRSAPAGNADKAGERGYIDDRFNPLHADILRHALNTIEHGCPHGGVH
jgi:hypothetical protein